MKCPNNCNVNLVMSDRNGVEIDYCPECRGVWLDRGELDKIIERSTNVQNTHSHSQGHRDKYSNSNERGYDPKKKKKDSFLGDLFDF